MQQCNASKRNGTRSCQFAPYQHRVSETHFELVLKWERPVATNHCKEFFSTRLLPPCVEAYSHLILEGRPVDSIRRR